MTRRLRLSSAACPTSGCWRAAWWAALQRELCGRGRREGRRASSQREEQRAAQLDVDRGQLRPSLPDAAAVSTLLGRNNFGRVADDLPAAAQLGALDRWSFVRRVVVSERDPERLSKPSGPGPQHQPLPSVPPAYIRRDGTKMLSKEVKKPALPPVRPPVPVQGSTVRRHTGIGFGPARTSCSTRVPRQGRRRRRLGPLAHRRRALERSGRTTRSASTRRRRRRRAARPSRGSRRPTRSRWPSCGRRRRCRCCRRRARWRRAARGRRRRRTRSS